MSRVRADKLVDRAGTGAVELTQGATLPSGKTISGSGTIAVTVQELLLDFLVLQILQLIMLLVLLLLSLEQ